MVRSLVRAIAAFAFAALIAPATPSAAPAPGIAYDEIVRVLANATPPPPGNFQADLAALAASPAPVALDTPAPRRRGMLGALAGAVLGGAGAGGIAGAAAGEAASNAMEDAVRGSLGMQFGALAGAMRGFLEPHLMRYAYWNGWVRIDDVVAQTATIRKCDAGQVVTLDLARKTYRLYSPDTEPAPATAAAAPPAARRGRAPNEDPAAPGTAVVTLGETTTSLGTLRIESQPATGYDTTTSVAMTQATGSCRDGSAAIRTVQYLAPLGRPTVNACPIRPALLPENASAAVTRTSGGCRPTFSAHRSGPASPSNRLALYSLVTLSGTAGAPPAPQQPGTAPPLGFLTERGNLRALGASDAGLFAIPSDFTKSPQ
jgi:hypothetical protein